MEAHVYRQANVSTELFINRQNNKQEYCRQNINHLTDKQIGKQNLSSLNV